MCDLEWALVTIPERSPHCTRKDMGRVFVPVSVSQKSRKNRCLVVFLNFFSNSVYHRYGQVHPVHYKYYEDDLQANLKSEINPFPLHSEWVDREVKVGHIDEDVSVWGW